ncbi:hypothetical protein ACTHTW_10805, partial [Neisseria sp. P0018.S006]
MAVSVWFLVGVVWFRGGPVCCRFGVWLGFWVLVLLVCWWWVVLGVVLLLLGWLVVLVLVWCLVVVVWFCFFGVGWLGLVCWFGFCLGFVGVCGCGGVGVGGGLVLFLGGFFGCFFGWVVWGCGLVWLFCFCCVLW